ncbi:MAG: hypothetical protein GXP21_07725 [Gammaproteobacteria bacterium]|nr:hypothetical protein [Gammaproteobacteria bacterium]
MCDLCICNSGKLFSKCCDRFLNQQEIAKSPERLMRSRYSAYALGGYGEYLLQTWLTDDVMRLDAGELSVKSVDWVSLDVLDKWQKGDEGFVEFKACFLQGDEKVAYHEKSLFKRANGKWLYAGVLA